jgi:hypothetical protein
VEYFEEAGEEGDELCEGAGVGVGRIAKRGRFCCQSDSRLDFPCSLGMDEAEKRKEGIGRRRRRPRSTRRGHIIQDDSTRNE